MNTELIPFGKYKGQPVAQLQNDAEYAKWLMQQPWFVERYSGIRTLIVNNFKEEAESPEHNKLQAAFLIPTNSYSAICAGFKLQPFMEWFGQFDIDSLHNDGYRSQSRFKVEFEVSGWDVVVDAHFRLYIPGSVNNQFWWGGKFPFELKPTLGEEFPVVLRQCKARGKSGCVLIKDFNCKSVSFEQVKQIFNASGFSLIMMSKENKQTPHTWMYK